MFQKSINQPRACALHFKRVTFPEEPLQPDNHGCVGWYHRLKRKLAASLFWGRHAAEQPQALAPEVFVPDDRLALFIENGKPDRWIQPGRHQLPLAKAKVEVRLFSPDVLQDQDYGHCAPLALAQTLPYERALLYVDGGLVAIVKPGNTPERHSNKYLGAGTPEPLEARSLAHSAALHGEDDRIQVFSFI